MKLPGRRSYRVTRYVVSSTTAIPGRLDEFLLSLLRDSHWPRSTYCSVYCRSVATVKVYTTTK